MTDRSISVELHIGDDANPSPRLASALSELASARLLPRKWPAMWSRRPTTTSSASRCRHSRSVISASTLAARWESASGRPPAGSTKTASVAATATSTPTETHEPAA